VVESERVWRIQTNIKKRGKKRTSADEVDGLSAPKGVASKEGIDRGGEGAVYFSEKGRIRPD